MSEYQFPSAALQQHIAVLGKTGSGKTSTGKLIVEHKAALDERVCILDPIKSDWWGLTSSADGRRPGLPFYILGGPRGHVPLHESAGAAIGELVATGELPLSIIDMADFKPGGLQKFFNDFAPALIRKMRGVLTLVIEEAHEFAPKERSGIGAESTAIHFAKKLATAGRSKGIRLIVLTQRTQALHNAVLGSCDTMIAHRLTAPADQAPVRAWLKANTDKEVQREVEGSLASLRTGTGWVCSGEAMLFEKVQFPKISTYDNSATPTGDSKEHRVTTAAVDQDRLRSIIGEAVKEAEDTDPKQIPKLRAEIARLTADASRRNAEPAQAAHDPQAMAAAEQCGYDEGAAAGQRAGVAAVMADVGAVEQRIVDGVRNVVQQAIADFTLEHRLLLDQRPVVRARTAPLPAKTAAPARQFDKPAKTDGLPGPESKILSSLATWSAMGHDTPSNAMVAWLAGYSPSSTSYTNPRGALKTKGFLSYPQPDHLKMSDAGSEIAQPARIVGTLLQHVLTQLPGPEKRILEAIAAAYPSDLSNDEAAPAAGYTATSTSYTNPRGALKTKSLITYPAQGRVQAADWLFP